ncbi:MAG: uracil-DNA glycosylase [bacterium]
MFLNSISIHNTWADFIEENKSLVHEIETKIDIDVMTPTPKKALRFLETDLYKLKVVILGQDPYPQDGIATGKAFQIGGLDDWNKKFRQTSLRNILRLLYKTYNNIYNYNNIPKFKDIIKKINAGDFNIKNPFNLFESWWNQGVLLLNTSLSCEIGEPKTHEEIWAPFTKNLIKYISNKRPDLIWFLWGTSAQKQKKYISNGVFHESRHPMMCSQKYENDFLKADCFNDTKDFINWLG